jgi:hypothetical protein
VNGASTRLNPAALVSLEPFGGIMRFSIAPNFDAACLISSEFVSGEVYMQLFQHHHYTAFDPPKPNQDDAGTRSEREAVRDALLELHEMLWPLIRREKWDLHHHWYEPAIVSSFHFVPRIVHRISAMWLSYGKSKGQLQFLKEMGGLDRRNPHLVDDYDGFYHHARIQFLVNSSAFHCWLLGKPK